jgi:hypothetical protein
MDTFLLQKITMDPHIPAYVNIEFWMISIQH